jgi:hypothetical protein
MLLNPRCAAKTLASVAAVTGLLTAGATTAAAAESRSAAGNPAFEARAILSGSQLHHRFRKAGSTKWRRAPLSLPDDIFTAFQNGVGPQGQAAPAETGTAPSSRSRRTATRWLSGTSAASATA